MKVIIQNKDNNAILNPKKSQVLKYLHKSAQLYFIFNLVIFLVIINLFVYLNYDIYAVSPSFVRQEIKDNDGDWTFYNLYGDRIEEIYSEEKMKDYSGSIVGDIHSVSYISDGKTFNSTFWINAPFNNTLLEKTNHIPSYYIYFDTDLNAETGLGGIDYIQGLEWNKTSKSWKVKIYETTDRPTGQRIIKESDYSHHGKNQGGIYDYVFLSLDLNLLNNPSEYRVIFFARDEMINIQHTEGYVLFDVLNTVNVPLPTFSLVTKPSKIMIGNNQMKDVEIIMKSNASVSTLQGLLPQIIFSSKYSCINKDITEIESISLCFSPNIANISSDGFSTTRLVISHSNLSPGTYTVPIIAEINYPSELFLAGTNKAVDSYKTTQIFYIPITVKGFFEQLKDWVNDIFNPVYALISGIIAIITSIVGALAWLRIRRKRGKEKENERNNKDFG
ncbi:MAG: hypothetical protein ACPKPY_09855 [Nitrososphaeraceae archaeon]